ncbi:hypothetical protein AMTRI_Chr09g42160 [Amborella trichopoda]
MNKVGMQILDIKDENCVSFHGSNGLWFVRWWLNQGRRGLINGKHMGRFGNKIRALITKCASWMKLGIIYVKRDCLAMKGNEIVGISCSGTIKVLLHLHTHERKAKLEATETGYHDEDQISTDEDEEGNWELMGDYEVEDEEGETKNWGEYDEEDEEQDEDKVVEAEGQVELGIRKEDARPEERKSCWKEDFEKAVRSPKAMDDWLRGKTKKLDQEKERIKPKPAREEWEHIGYDTRRIRKIKVTPDLFKRI